MVVVRPAGRAMRVVALTTAPLAFFLWGGKTMAKSTTRPTTTKTTSQPMPGLPTLALSIRQPWAELIMRGTKTIEERSKPTRVRGRIFIYASLGRYRRADEVEWAKEFDIDIDGLPRGLIVGTVELFACDGQEWRLRLPERLPVPIAPLRHPCPVFFRPF